METYVFKLLGDDETVLDVRSAVLPDLRAVWSAIAGMADRKDMTGGRIIVTNCSGEVLILVGVATARSCAAPPKKRAADAAPGIPAPWPRKPLRRLDLWTRRAKRQPAATISAPA